MEYEAHIDDQEEVRKYVQDLTKFAKPIYKGTGASVYNIKDPHIRGLLWIVSKAREND